MLVGDSHPTIGCIEKWVDPRKDSGSPGSPVPQEEIYRGTWRAKPNSICGGATRTRTRTKNKIKNKMVRMIINLPSGRRVARLQGLQTNGDGTYRGKTNMYITPRRKRQLGMMELLSVSVDILL